MANGTTIADGYGWLQHKFIDAVAATDDGVWFDCGNYRTAAFHIKGITTATVKINGSCGASKPAASDHEGEMASTATNNTIVTVEPLPRWIKARISAWTSGTITVIAVFRK